MSLIGYGEEHDMKKRRPMDDAPRDGTVILGYHADGQPDRVFWSEERYCVLGAPMGSFGPEWLSVDAGNLPVDEPESWEPSK